MAVGRRKPACGKRWRKARSTQVLPAPGSPVRITEACSSTASCSSATTDSFEGGSQRSPSAISLEKGVLSRLKCEGRRGS